MCQLQKNSGFTLVELSIVIVTIGLVVAAVTAGQALVKQAKLRGVISNIEKLTVAANSFKLEYGYLPGDLPTAQSYFGAGACPDVGLNLCNGNGDGTVNQVSNFSEASSVFVHLSLAKLLPGNYTQVTNDVFTNNINMMADSIATYSLMQNNNTGWGLGARKPPKIILSSIQWSGSFYQDGINMIPKEVKNVDTKIDDGVAGKGRMFCMDGTRLYGSSTGVTLKDCSDPWSDATPDDYNLTSTKKACRCFIDAL